MNYCGLDRKEVVHAMKNDSAFILKCYTNGS